MSGTNRTVRSREFKVSLKVGLFREIESGSEALWELVKSIVHKGGGEAKPDDRERRRTTWYLDTSELEFRERHGYILRLREENDPETKKYKITLKYRNADRYISAS